MILSFTLITFIAFVIWNESYRLRLAMRDLIDNISGTYSKANGIYQNPRSYQEWMRRNTIQTYK